MNKKAIIYTDGSCYYHMGSKSKKNDSKSPQKGPGAWGFIITDESGTILRRRSGFIKKCTHNEAELTAIIEALRMINGSELYKYFDIHSDSRYCVDGMNSHLPGWKNKKFHFVANAELWKQIYILFTPIKNRMNVIWIKGHNGNIIHNEVDRMCKEQIETNTNNKKPSEKKEMNAASYIHLIDKKISVKSAKGQDTKIGTMFSVNTIKNTIGVLLENDFEYIFYLNNANLEIQEINEENQLPAASVGSDAVS